MLEKNCLPFRTPGIAPPARPDRQAGLARRARPGRRHRRRVHPARDSLRALAGYLPTHVAVIASRATATGALRLATGVAELRAWLPIDELPSVVVTAGATGRPCTANAVPGRELRRGPRRGTPDVVGPRAHRRTRR